MYVKRKRYHHQLIAGCGGFCSQLVGLLYYIKEFVKPGDTIEADWTPSKVNWFKKQQFNYSSDPNTNAWPYYFEPLSEKTAPYEADSIQAYLWPCFRLVPGEAWGPVSLPLYLGYQPWRSEFNRLWNKWVRPKTIFVERADEILQGRKCIGVHVRLQNWHRYEELADIPLERYITMAERFIRDDEYFFVATDDSDAFDTLKSRWGDRMISQEVVRLPQSDNWRMEVHTNDFDGVKIGSEMLVDLLCLGRCRELIHSISNVAMMAAVLKPDIELRYARGRT